MSNVADLGLRDGLTANEWKLVSTPLADLLATCQRDPQTRQLIPSRVYIEAMNADEKRRNYIRHENDEYMKAQAAKKPPPLPDKTPLEKMDPVGAA